MDTSAWFFALILFTLILPTRAFAVLVEFESTCNDDAPFVSGSNGSCALFGLGPTDTVTGAFSFDDSLYTPGQGQSLASDQYDFLFQFGNQSFTEADNTLALSFLISNNGITISSIAGVFVNASGAQLNLLTPSTVRILLGGNGADTFGEGYAWAVTPPPQVPVPAALWLFLSGLGLLPLVRRRVLTASLNRNTPS